MRDNGLLTVTNRQREILLYVAAGYIHKEIAEVLGISWQTVKNHMHQFKENNEMIDEPAAHMVFLAMTQGVINDLEVNALVEERHYGR